MPGAHRRIPNRRLIARLVAVAAVVAGLLVAGGLTATTSASADTASCVVFTSSTPPAARLLLPYNQQIVVSGGTAPYTFTLVSGHLPPGLKLSSSGDISGIPLQVGYYYFGIKVTDSAPSPCSSVFGYFMQVSSGNSTGDSLLLWAGEFVQWVQEFSPIFFVDCLMSATNTLLYSEPPDPDCMAIVPPLP